MPKMGNVGVANAGAFGYSIADLGSIYYIAYFGSTSKTFRNYAIATDSSGNIYSGGQNASDNITWFNKINRSGPSLGFQKTAPFSSITYYLIVNNENIWAVFAGSIYKMDLSGNLVYASTPNGFSTIYKIILSGTTLYVIGASSTANNCAVASLNVTSNLTTGNFLYRYSQSTPADSFYGGCLDSAGNIIAAGSRGSTAGCVTKITPGTLAPVWLIASGRSGSTATRYLDACSDSSNNVYAVGYSNTSTLFGLCFVKILAAGTRSFFRIAAGSSGDQFNACAISTDEAYVYAVGQRGTSAYIFVFGTASGTVYFQRSISAGTSCIGRSIQVTADAMYIGVTFTPTGLSSVSLVLSLPLDGSKTGTYTVGGQSISYSSASVTASAPAMNADVTTAWATQSSASINPTNVTSATSTSTYDVFSALAVT